MALDVKISRDNLFFLLSQAHSLIEKRNILPILSKVLIEAKKKESFIQIQATDQDNSMQSFKPAQVKEEGKTVVDAQTLFDVLKELPEGDVYLTGDSKKLQLKQGASVFHLLCMSVQDFPAFPPFDMKESFKINKDSLKEMIERSIYCASMDDTRYHLTGVFFETVKKDKKYYFRFTATDGHRLGLVDSVAGGNFLEKSGVIISRKAVQEIRKLISYSDEEEVEISLEKPRLLFRIGPAVLSVKLVEGSYPNYQPLIPKDYAVRIKVNVEEFSQVLKRVALLSNSRFKGVTFSIKNKVVQMEAEHPDIGSAKDKISCLELEGNSLQVRFNARYILEALATISQEEVFMEFRDKNKPVLIQTDKKDSGLAVVMPMKI